MVLAIVILLAACLIVAAALYLLIVGNRLARQRTALAKAWSGVEILLKQRVAELPRLVATVKSYDASVALTMVTEARAATERAAAMEEKARADETLAQALKALFAAAEKLPDLKTNNSFREVRGRITTLGEQVAAERQSFNGGVDEFNSRLARFPESVVARFMALKAQPRFEAPTAGRSVGSH